MSNTEMIPYPYEEYSSFWEDVFHDKNYDGLIFVCGKTRKDKFFTIRALARHEFFDYLKTFEINPDMDYYFTISQFIKKKGGTKRRSNNLLATCGAVVDIDLHDTRATPKDVEYHLSSYKAKLDTLIALGEAFPYHYCVYTGRGIQLIYLYEWAVNFKLEIMYKRMHELILRQHTMLLEDNPNILVKLDAGTTKRLSGVYRMPGTYHTKAKKEVTYVKTDYRYLDTSKIIDEYGFFDVPYRPGPLETYPINSTFAKKKTKRKSNNISHHRKLINAVYQYQEDEYAEKLHPGHENRNCTLFVLIHLLLVVQSYEETLQEALAFNRNFKVPLREKRITTMLDYAYENFTDDKKYRMRFLKVSTILELLDLEDGDYDIHDNSEARKKLEEERAIRRAQKKSRDETICELYRQGLEYSEIAQKAECCVRTVNRVIDKYYPRKEHWKNQFDEVARLYLTGMPYEEIAATLNISLRTVNNAVAQAYPKSSRPKPWADAGMKKEDYYAQYKRDIMDKSAFNDLNT